MKGQLNEDGCLRAVEAVASGPISEVPWMTREVPEKFWDTVNMAVTCTGTWRSWKGSRKPFFLFSPVPRSEATWKLMTLKWVETSKGNDTNPNCRSRWKLRDIKARRKAAQQMEAKDFILERATLGSNFGRTILGLNLRLVQLVPRLGTSLHFEPRASGVAPQRACRWSARRCAAANALSEMLEK